MKVKNDVEEFLLDNEVKENHQECLQILNDHSSRNQVKYLLIVDFIKCHSLFVNVLGNED